MLMVYLRYGAFTPAGSETENEEADPTSQPPVQHMVKEVHTVEQPQDVVQSDSANLLDPSSHSLIQTNEVSKVQSSKISTVQTVTNSSQQQSVQYEVNAEDPNSTLKRLNRDIKELGSIIDHMDPGTVDEKSASSLAVTADRSEVVSRFGRTEALHVTEEDRQGIPGGVLEDSRRAGSTGAIGTVERSKGCAARGVRCSLPGVGCRYVCALDIVGKKFDFVCLYCENDCCTASSMSSLLLHPWSQYAYKSYLLLPFSCIICLSIF